jgi:ABC-type multidrug transport system ATPase subunit
MQISKQQMFSELLGAVRDGERTVFISSHAITDLERFADHVGMIKNGTLVFEGAVSGVPTGTASSTSPPAILSKLPTNRASWCRPGRSSDGACYSIEAAPPSTGSGAAARRTSATRR